MRNKNLKAPVGKKVRVFLPVRVRLEHNQFFMGKPPAKQGFLLQSFMVGPPWKCDRSPWRQE